MDSTVRKIVETLIKEGNLDDESLDQIPYAVMLINQEKRVEAANQAAQNLGVIVGSYCWDTFGKCASIPEMVKETYQGQNILPVGGTKCSFCLAEPALSSQAEKHTLLTIGETTWDTYWIPAGDNTYLHFGINITE